MKYFFPFLIALIFVSIPHWLVAQSLISPADTFPVPTGNKYQLFYLQRQPNKNTIVVELNIKNAVVDEDNPVHVFWLRYGDHGQKQELNFIQRNFAYGIKSKKTSPGNYELHFVSYKKLKIILEKDATNTWRTFYNSANGQKIILRRVYLHINGGSFWKPNVEYVELKGNDFKTNAEIRERVKLS